MVDTSVWFSRFFSWVPNPRRVANVKQNKVSKHKKQTSKSGFIGITRYRNSSKEYHWSLFFPISTPLTSKNKNSFSQKKGTFLSTIPECIWNTCPKAPKCGHIHALSWILYRRGSCLDRLSSQHFSLPPNVYGYSKNRDGDEVQQLFPEELSWPHFTIWVTTMGLKTEVEQLKDGNLSKKINYHQTPEMQVKIWGSLETNYDLEHSRQRSKWEIVEQNRHNEPQPEEIVNLLPT